MIKIEAANAIVIVNWNTTRLFLIILPLLLCEKFPFKEIAGLNDDSIAAGYIPDTADIKTTNASMIKIFVPLSRK